MSIWQVALRELNMKRLDTCKKGQAGVDVYRRSYLGQLPQPTNK